jgi:hypothetical protein
MRRIGEFICASLETKVGELYPMGRRFIVIDNDTYRNHKQPLTTPPLIIPHAETNTIFISTVIDKRL